MNLLSKRILYKILLAVVLLILFWWYYVNYPDVMIAMISIIGIVIACGAALFLFLKSELIEEEK